MREFDFLPEWYQESRRRQSRMRRQYIALVLIFLTMITFNVTALHRAGRATAQLARRSHERMQAESIVYEFDLVTRQLNELRAKAELMERMDSRIDVAAVLAEMSHVIGEPVVLGAVKFVAEPLTRLEDNPAAGKSAVRVIRKTESPGTEVPLGNVRFRIILSGLAARPGRVADLVCRLEDSAYFERVHPSFSRNTRTQIGALRTEGANNGGGTANQEMFEVTEFEITCYLANCKDTES